MAVSTFVGAFNIGVGIAGTTVDVTPSGCTISGTSIIFLWTAGRSNGIDASGRGNRLKSFGWAISTSDRRAQASQSQDAAAAATGGSAMSDAACLLSITTGTTPDGAADFDSWLSNGARLIIDDQFNINLRVHYWLITGLDNAESVTWQDTSSTGDKVITTGLSFQPTAEVFIATVVDGAPPSGRAGNEMIGIGFAVASGAGNQATYTGGNDEGSANGDADSYCLDDECLASMTAGGGTTLGSRWTFVSQNSNGFTLNQTIIPATLCYNFGVALKGGSWAVKSVTTQTDTTTDINTSSLGFTPAGAFLISACKAEHTAGTPTIHDSWSWGATDGTNRGAQAGMDEDGVANMEVTTAIEHDEVYASINTSSVVEGLMDLKTWADPITFIMDDADPSAKFVSMLVVGNVDSGSSVNKSESISVTENKVAEVSAPQVNKSDSIAVSESVTNLVNSFVNVSDAAAVSESVALQVVNVINVSDAVAVGESNAIVVSDPQVNKSESIAVTESYTPVIEVLINKSEAIAVTENQTVEIVTAVNVNDSIAVTESKTAVVEVLINKSETVAVTESHAETVSTSQINVNDAVSVSESKVVTIAGDTSLSVNISESVSISESLALAVGTSAINVGENISLAELLFADVGAPAVNVSDAISLSESVILATSAPQVGVSDAVSLAENWLAAVVSGTAFNFTKTSAQFETRHKPAFENAKAVTLENRKRMTVENDKSAEFERRKKVNIQ